METPEIDSVSWIQPVKEQPLTIRVSTHGDPGKPNITCGITKKTGKLELIT